MLTHGCIDVAVNPRRTAESARERALAIRFSHHDSTAQWRSPRVGYRLCAHNPPRGAFHRQRDCSRHRHRRSRNFARLRADLAHPAGQGAADRDRAVASGDPARRRYNAHSRPTVSYHGSRSAIQAGTRRSRCGRVTRRRTHPGASGHRRAFSCAPGPGWTGDQLAHVCPAGTERFRAIRDGSRCRVTPGGGDAGDSGRR